MPAANILETIVAGKREEVATARRQVDEVALRDRIDAVGPTRDFLAALRNPPAVSLIAEVKKASPSAGLIRADFDPVTIAETYAAAGAACLSVLTDERWFQGSPRFLSDIRDAVRLPLLRKDFVIDGYQLLEARAWGADAALLIVAILPPAELADLLARTRELELTPLVEVHTEEETDIAVAAGAELIGINNRDLKVFETNLATTFRLRERIPADRVVVSESGIKTPADVARLRAAGIDAMLIGEALMREADLGAKTREMTAAGRGER